MTQVPVEFAMRVVRAAGEPVAACVLAGRHGWNSHAWAYALRAGGARYDGRRWSA